MSIICGATSADLSVAVCSCLQLGPAWQLTAVSQPSASQDCAAQLANEGRNAIFWSIYNVGGLTAVCRCRPLPGGARYDLMCIFPMISGLVSRVAPWFLLLPVRLDITGTGAGAGTLILICTHFVTRHIRGLNLIHIQPYSQTLLSELLNTFRKKTFIL